MPRNFTRLEPSYGYCPSISTECILCTRLCLRARDILSMEFKSQFEPCCGHRAWIGWIDSSEIHLLTRSTELKITTIVNSTHLWLIFMFRLGIRKGNRVHICNTDQKIAIDRLLTLSWSKWVWGARTSLSCFAFTVRTQNCRMTVRSFVILITPHNISRSSFLTP